VAARRDIVDALAHTALNAGVDGLRFHVSRHRFGDGLACLYCPYVDTEAALGEPEVYQLLTGLPAARVHKLLGGAPLNQDDVARMVDNGRLPPGADTGELEGGRIQDVARVRLYGQAQVRLGDGPLAVSAPFVAALAGSIPTTRVAPPDPGQRSTVGSAVIPEHRHLHPPERRPAESWSHTTRYQTADLAVGGSNPSRRASKLAAQRPCNKAAGIVG
jgi:hypothetical protein